jgi:hypothetical protein
MMRSDCWIVSVPRMDVFGHRWRRMTVDRCSVDYVGTAHYQVAPSTQMIQNDLSPVSGNPLTPILPFCRLLGLVETPYLSSCHQSADSIDKCIISSVGPQDIINALTPVDAD